MRKKKISKLSPLLLMLAGIFSSSRALAEFSQPVVYGPPPIHDSAPVAAYLFLVGFSVILIPIAIIAGTVIYFLKKRKRRNVEKISKIGKP